MQPPYWPAADYRGANDTPVMAFLRRLRNVPKLKA
jgi:hypothetical protein